MREILFRGRSLFDGEFVFGHYFTKKLCDGKPRHHYIKIDGSDGVEVDPESIGQFIGRLDVAGEKIFEGDVMEGKFGTGMGGKSTRYKEARFSISYHENISQFHLNYPERLGPFCFFPRLEDCKVVGQAIKLKILHR